MENNYSAKISWQLIIILVISAVLITVMLAPNLSLAPFRYTEGSIITQDIVIKENVSVEDEKSTQLKRQEAAQSVPPVYDYDPRLLSSATEAIQNAFNEARQRLSDAENNRIELQKQIKALSISQININSSISAEQKALSELEELQRIYSDRLANLQDDQKSITYRKLTLDIRIIDYKINQTNRVIQQLSTRLERNINEYQAALDNQLKDNGGLSFLADFESLLRVNLSPTEFETLAAGGFSQSLEEDLIKLMQLALTIYIVADVTELQDITRLNIYNLSSEDWAVFEDVQAIISLDTAIEEVNTLTEIFADTGRRELLASIAQKMIAPNLTKNTSSTVELQNEAMALVTPVYFNLSVGDVIARAGTTATAQQAEIIQALRVYNNKNPKYPQLIGVFLIISACLLLTCYVLRSNKDESNARHQIWLSVIALVTTVVVGQGLLSFMPALGTIYGFEDSLNYKYALPTALGAMLGGILLNKRAALWIAFCNSLFLAIMMGNSFSFFIYCAAGSAVAAHPVANYETRNAIWYQGLRLAGINVLVVAVLALINYQTVRADIVSDLMLSIVGAITSTAFTAIISPILERVFGITTNMRLLELSNMNHPALKDLAANAPGTYQHSLMVGTLGEAVASPIGARSLLVRVASYYHDLGKMNCPYYFVENQNNKNPHDELPPETSAQIIIDHVQGGVTRANEHRLGEDIVDIIEQHHGTSLIRYFYHRSQKTEPVTNIEDYRYPGPKPQTREAAIVMLADITEASTRSLSEPSEQSISDMVKKVITTAYTDGQLDESSLKLSDLSYIEKRFIKILLSIHHQRISYPDQDSDEELSNATN